MGVAVLLKVCSIATAFINPNPTLVASGPVAGGACDNESFLCQDILQIASVLLHVFVEICSRAIRYSFCYSGQPKVRPI